MKMDTRLILALDITDRSRAFDIVDRVSDHVDAVKVNYPFVLACGMDAVKELASRVDVICDFKVADIPNTNRLIVEQVGDTGASGVICQTFPGEDSLRACVLAAGDMHVFAVTEMSHPGAERFMAPVADGLARTAVRAGVDGIIAPATRPDSVKRLRAVIGDLLILSPGVGAQGGSAADAVRAGADYVIVGRGIYQASDPGEAARRIAREIQGALE